MIAKCAADYVTEHLNPKLEGGFAVTVPLRLTRMFGSDYLLDLTLYVCVMVSQDAPAEYRNAAGLTDLSLIIPGNADAVATLDTAALLGTATLADAERGVIASERAFPIVQKALDLTLIDADAPGALQAREAAHTALWTLAGDTPAVTAALTLATLALRVVCAK